MKVWKLTLLLLVLVMAVGSTARAGDEVGSFAEGLELLVVLHVAVGGDDALADGSKANPFGSLVAAAKHARPGTAIRMSPGEYRGGIALTDLAGTAEAPIWIGGQPGQDLPLVRGGTTGLHLVRARYVVVHDIEITGASGNGVNADDGGAYSDEQASHHLSFERLLIHDIGKNGNEDGLKLSGLRDFRAIDCDIARCGGNGSGSGIDMVGCHRGLIVGCQLHDLSANGVQCKGGTEDVEIRWCRFTDAGLRGVNIGGSTGFEYFRPPLQRDAVNWEARDIRIVRNVIEGSQASIAFVGATNCAVSNNTLIRPGKWILRILQESRSGNGFEFGLCGDNRFDNNLVYFERASVRRGVEVNIGPETRAGTVQFTSNLWFARDDPAHSQPMLPSDERGSVIGIEPLLFDVEAGDYRPRQGSPAIGAAVAPVTTAGMGDGGKLGRTIGACEPD